MQQVRCLDPSCPISRPAARRWVELTSPCLLSGFAVYLPGSSTRTRCAIDSYWDAKCSADKKGNLFAQGGHFSIRPVTNFSTKQAYLPSSNVLATKVSPFVVLLLGQILTRDVFWIVRSSFPRRESDRSRISSYPRRRQSLTRRSCPGSFDGSRSSEESSRSESSVHRRSTMREMNTRPTCVPLRLRRCVDAFSR